MADEDFAKKYIAERHSHPGYAIVPVVVAHINEDIQKMLLPGCGAGPFQTLLSVGLCKSEMHLVQYILSCLEKIGLPVACNLQMHLKILLLMCWERIPILSSGGS